MKNALIPVLGLALITVACNKNSSLDQAQYSDNPLFYLSGSVNGLPINLQAGKDGYALFTNYYLQDSVLHMESTLSKDAAILREAFKIDIHGGETSNDIAATNYATSLINGAVALADPSGYPRLPHVYDYSFTIDSLNSDLLLLWNTPDSSYYGDSCRYWAVNSLLNPSFKVEMLSAGALSCTPYVAHTIQSQGNCKAEMHILKSTNSELKAEVRERVGSIRSIQWTVNGTNIGSGMELNYDVLGFSPGYTLKANILFDNGCSEVIEKIILAGSSQCDINLNYQKEAHRYYNPNNLATVTISYFDADGKEYRSDYANNVGDFSIEAIASYNETSQSATSTNENHKRFTFSGNLILKNIDGSSLTLDNIFGIFAVEHPD
jgi:hypothetical protein